MRIVVPALALALLAASCSSTATETTPAASEPTEEAEAATEDVFDYGTVDYDGEPAGSALRGDRLDSAFPPPVVDVGDIASGGPPPDGIPPIDDPVFVTPEEATFLGGDDEGVVVVEINGDARAYPIQIMIWHEIVNDEIGGVPVTVTYCPLCNSAIVFDRRLGDRLLDFGTSGELYQSALVMYDRQTESLWAHFTGQGLVGHYAGAQLELIPAQTIGFGAFKEAHPDGKVLGLDTGANRNYGANPYVGYDDVSTNPIAPFISQPIDDTQAAKARVIGIVDEIGAVGYLLDEVADVGVVPVSLDGRNSVIFHTSGLASSLEGGGIADGRDVGQTGVFVAEADDGSALTFSTDGEVFTDVETGSTWNILGRATSGPLAGQQLQPVTHIDTFWFSWSTYQPDQTLVRI